MSPGCDLQSCCLDKVRFLIASDAPVSADTARIGRRIAIIRSMTTQPKSSSPWVWLSSESTRRRKVPQPKDSYPRMGCDGLSDLGRMDEYSPECYGVLVESDACFINSRVTCLDQER